VTLVSQIAAGFAAVATAINARAKIASPTFTGTPAAPTASAGTNTTQLATTAFTTAAIAASQLNVSITKSTSYTLALTDAAGPNDTSSATAMTITIPTNASVAFPNGTTIEISQQAAGQVTVAGASGVTISSAGSLVKTRVQGSAVSLRKISTNLWSLVGDLA
jgi:hypothetical protein